MNIAPEVINQLGGNRFLAITGTKPQYYDDKTNSCAFRLVRNNSKANFMIIKLNDSDTYTVQFIKATEKEYKILVEESGIYNDMLQRLFTDVTGLYTKLF